MRITRRGRRIYLLGAISLVCAAACVSLVVLLTGASTPAFPDQLPKVRAAFQGAMVSSFTLAAQNPDFESLAVGVPAEPRLRQISERRPVAAGIPAALTSAQLDKTRKRMAAEFAKYFTPAATKHEMGLANGMIDNLLLNPDYRDLGAGVSNIVIQSVLFDPSGSRATVQALLSCWVAATDRMPDGTWQETHPSGDMNVTAEMVKQASGEWLMDSYVGIPAPGSEP
jgi:hypothetical protein